MEHRHAPPQHALPAGRIEDYALIGDCRTAALVSRGGSIDWLCWPRFDSPACFAALLDSPRAGRWLVAPVDPGAEIRRRYRPDTMILETTFATAAGTVQLIDFMPTGGSGSAVVRILRGLTGRVELRTELALRFDYGSVIPWVTRLATGFGLTAIAGPDLVVLHSSIPLKGRDFVTEGRFALGAGEEAAFVLAHGPSHLPAPAVPEPSAALEATDAFWSDWSRRGTYRGDWPDAVQRSLLTLKALTYAETGGIVAAPTTSLPELPGGTRNWDYRYCWLRDATFTLQALIQAGHREEARAWAGWLRRSAAGHPGQLQTLYGLAGERRLIEWEADWLAGFGGARPVRIGNAASTQLQIDVFGEVVDAIYQAGEAGLAPAREIWGPLRALAEHVTTLWDQPDESIWEVRGGRRHFVFSKVMAWVALDRAVRAGEQRRLAVPLDRWRRLRAEIHDQVCRHGFDAGKNSFVQAYGSTALDASALLIPLVGFLPATDPRVLGTVAAIERELMPDGLVLRYRPEEASDGIAGGEGAFLACSFWLVDNLALQGRMPEARALFARLVGLANDVGLLAEEYDPVAGAQRGNFPQAFSHLALVNAAFTLAAADPAAAAQRR